MAHPAKIISPSDATAGGVVWKTQKRGDSWQGLKNSSLRIKMTIAPNESFRKDITFAP